MASVKSPLHEAYSVAELGSVFGYGVNTLKDRLNRAQVEPAEVSKDGVRKRYTLSATYEALMRLAKDEYDSGGLGEPTSHKERLEMLKAEEQEMKNRIMAGELVNQEDVAREFSQAITVVKNRLLTLPRKLAPRSLEIMDVVEIEEEFDRELREILEELSNYEAQVE
jgi:phage terminase Nu1 subunit (DNA packaging protein)